MIETNGDVKTNEVLVFFENKRIGLKALINLLQEEGKIFIRGNKSFQQKGHLGGYKNEKISAKDQKLSAKETKIVSNQ